MPLTNCESKNGIGKHLQLQSAARRSCEVETTRYQALEVHLEQLPAARPREDPGQRS